MADVSVPSLILFIASIVIAAGVAGVLIDTVTGISGALDDRGADVAENVRTDVEVISDSESNVYDGNGNLTLYVKNTGRRTIPATGESFDVIVNAQYQTDVTVSVADGNGDEWMPHGVVKVTVEGLSLDDNSDHRVRLVVSGDEETFRFTT